MPNNADIAVRKRMHQDVRMFFEQVDAQLGDMPASEKMQQLIANVAAGKGLPADLVARFKEYGELVAKEQLIIDAQENQSEPSAPFNVQAA